MYQTLLQVCLLLALSGCTHGKLDSSPPEPRQLNAQYFTFNYTSLDDNNIHVISDTLERNFQRIMNDLAVSSIPTITIIFYDNIASLRAGVSSLVPDLPSWATGLATSTTEIHMLSPNHPDQKFQNILKVVVHEFTHCVTLNINSNFANNPRWLWESIALYEARQFVTPKSLRYMVNQSPHTLAELNSFSNKNVYEVGFLYAEFIIKTWGKEKLKNLIEANGNTTEVLQVSADQFQTQWFAFVKVQYGI